MIKIRKEKPKIEMRGRFVVAKISYLFPYLTRFVMFFAIYFHFCFVKSLIIKFAMGGAESKGVDIVVRFSE